MQKKCIEILENRTSARVILTQHPLQLEDDQRRFLIYRSYRFVPVNFVSKAGSHLLKESYYRGFLTHSKKIRLTSEKSLLRNMLFYCFMSNSPLSELTEQKAQRYPTAPYLRLKYHQSTFKFNELDGFLPSIVYGEDIDSVLTDMLEYSELMRMGWQLQTQAAHFSSRRKSSAKKGKATTEEEDLIWEEYLNEKQSCYPGWWKPLKDFKLLIEPYSDIVLDRIELNAAIIDKITYLITHSEEIVIKNDFQREFREEFISTLAEVQRCLKSVIKYLDDAEIYSNVGGDDYARESLNEAEAAKNEAQVYYSKSKKMLDDWESSCHY